jgi:orotate phosphoribosyltransferase
MESPYADPQLLRDLGARGARFLKDVDVDVVVGAETAGVPLAASISLSAELPFAFVRKPGYRGHEINEPPVPRGSCSRATGAARGRRDLDRHVS